MSRAGREEFYVGWEDRAPAGLSRRGKRVVIFLAVVLPVAVAWIAAAQSPLPDGNFEYGKFKTFEGVLNLEPVPMLRPTVPVPGRHPRAPLLLVGLGKRGVPDEARDKDGKTVRFKGSLIFRDEMAMIEMNDPESIEVIDDAEAPRPPRGGQERIPMTLTGELVDSKCFLGAMRPATGKVHRACAIRCLSGGIPPGLLLRRENGDDRLVLLIGEDGAGVEIDPELAGRQLRVSGHLDVHDGLPVFRAGAITLVDGR